MKVLVSGCGSIGQRHANNLDSEGHELLLFDPDYNKARGISEPIAGETVESLEEGIETSPDAAFICSPANHHVEQAMACVDEEVPVFMEKPLSHSMDGVQELVEAAEERDVVTMVGCNMRFTEGLQKIKEVLPSLGKLVWADIEFGHDLREWRETDYRDNYAVSHDSGGGIVLDSIHELDYALWLFGEPIESYSKAVKSGTLEIETEDSADFLLQCERCPSVTIHLDYLQPEYTRECRIIGEKGFIHWDFGGNSLNVFINGENSRRQVDTEANDMYLRQTRHFLKHVKEGEEPMNPVREAAETLRHVLELREEGLE